MVYMENHSILFLSKQNLCSKLTSLLIINVAVYILSILIEETFYSTYCLKDDIAFSHCGIFIVIHEE